MDSSIQTPTEHRKIISRKEARKQGLTHYFTGKPCKLGHIAERHTIRRDCIECSRLKSREYYWNDPVAENARRKAQRQAKPEHYKTYSRLYSAKWKQANPDKANAQNRAWRQKNPEKASAMRLRWEEKHKLRLQDDPAYADAWKQRERDKNRAARDKRDIERTGSVRPDHCEICLKKTPRIHYDHCHASGNFRGWLCQQCNHALGNVNDSSETLRRMLDFLEQHKTS